jgi:hypothetical protein
MVKFIFQLTKIIIAAVMLLLAISCGNNVNFMNDGLTGDGDVTTSKRTADNFNGIEAKTGIKVIIEQSDNYAIEVKTNKNLQEHLKTEVSNGVLAIYFDKNINTADERTVYVKVPNLRKISSSSGSSVESITTIKSKNLDLKSSSGSEIKLRINAKNLTCDSSSGSEIVASGKSENLRTESSSGSSIILDDLEVANAVCKSSSGSSTQVNPTISLDADASSGSSIRYYTSPKQIKIDESSGASVSKK